MSKTCCCGDGEGRKDKGRGGGKMVCDKVVCVKDGVWQRWCGERWCVTKLCVKDGVSKMVCDKGVCERWCVKNSVWQSGVWKMVWENVKDGVWQSGVWKIVCDKVVCARWGVTKLCVKDGVGQSGVKDGVSKLVCQGWCLKDGVRQICVRKIVCQRWCGGSAYCACHAKGSRGPAAATSAAARPGGSVSCACHAKGSRGPSSSWRLCVLRLPHERQPRPSGGHAPQLVQEALCTAPATRKAAAAQRQLRAPQLLLEALWTAPATRKAAAAPPGVSVCCAERKALRKPRADRVSEWVSDEWWVKMKRRRRRRRRRLPRRDPSEKQEPHTVMWGTIIIWRCPKWMMCISNTHTYIYTHIYIYRLNVLQLSRANWANDEP